jgi:uncharacterized membrane protein
MDLNRIARHLFYPPWRVRSAFPAHALEAIERAIRASEATHGGEIRFAVEGALDGAPLFKGQSARERAIDAFSLLRIWDTERNNGVLIYLLLADRDVEIVADRGIHAKVGPAEWELICRNMESAFRHGDYEKGAIAGIGAVTAHLARHFPAAAGDRNELLDRAVLL